MTLMQIKITCSYNCTEITMLHNLYAHFMQNHSVLSHYVLQQYIFKLYKGTIMCFTPLIYDCMYRHVRCSDATKCKLTFLNTVWHFPGLGIPHFFHTRVLTHGPREGLHNMTLQTSE